MSLPRLKKVYFPGLISLVFLPLMCIWYLINMGTFHKYKILPVNWFNTKGFLRMMKFTKTSDLLTFRKFEELKINGDKLHDKLEIIKLNNLFQKLIINNDTINGIKVNIGEQARFQTIIDVLDRSNSFGNLNFSPIIVNNQALIFLIKTDDIILKPTDWENDNIHGSKLSQPLFSLSNLKKYVFKLSNVIFNFWPSILAFISMVGFTISSRRYLVIDYRV